MFSSYLSQNLKVVIYNILTVSRVRRETVANLANLRETPYYIYKKVVTLYE